MTHIVCLSPADRRLLCTRFDEHGNSHRRMADALAEAGADEAGARLHALRMVEKVTEASGAVLDATATLVYVNVDVGGRRSRPLPAAVAISAARRAGRIGTGSTAASTAC